MTTPDQNATNPTNAQPPHAETQPTAPPQQQQRQPVVVQTQDNSGLTERMNGLAQTVAGLPEQIVHAFREATQPAQAPVQQTPAQQANTSTGGSGAQAPGTNQNPGTDSPPASVEKSGPRVSRFAKWWYNK